MSKYTIENINTKNCTGCGLCKIKCPKSCIYMKEDKEGFRYPKIHSSMCINCGLCVRICPMTSAADNLYNKMEREFFCGFINNQETLLKSSSGGIFAVLANYIININGYVCGCVYNDSLEAIHVLSNDMKVIEKMYGSKYVQSHADHCFSKIVELLNSNTTVMFTGTACQIAALRLFIGKDYSNLYYVEILCHGVPSPGFFREYKKYLKKKLSAQIKDIKFRDKRKDGWGSEHRTCIIYEKNGITKEYRPILPAYFSSFFYGLNLRESCYNCRFATPERIADLTIGDFWGSWSKYRKRFDNGISVVGLNSLKGKQLIEHVKNKLVFFETLSEEEAVKSNDNFEHPINRPIERDNFYDNVFENGYKHIWKKTYLTKTYRKKTLASIYGAFIPVKLRFYIHSLKKK